MSLRQKVQSTGLSLYLIFGILLLAYALGFITNVYIFFAYGNMELSAFYDEMQVINTGLLLDAIWIILFAVFLYILELRKTAAGIITLLITLLGSVVCIVFSVRIMQQLLGARTAYLALDLSSLDRYIERGTISYTRSTFTYDLGLVIIILFILASLFLMISVFYNACKSDACQSDACRGEKS